MKTKLSGVAFVVAAALLSSVTAAHGGHVVLPTNPVALKRVAQELNVQLKAALAVNPHLGGIDQNLELLIAAAHVGGSLDPYINKVVADAKVRLHAAVAALLGVNGNFLAAVPAPGNVDVSGTVAAGFNIQKPLDDQRDTFIAGLDATLDGFKTMANLAVLDTEVAVPGGKDVVEIAKVANAVHHAIAKKVFEYVHGLAAVDAAFTIAVNGGVKTRDGLAMDLAKAAQGPQIKPQTLDQAPEPIYDAALKSVGQADCDLLIDASIVEAKKRLVAVLDNASGGVADLLAFLEDGTGNVANPAVQIRTIANETLDTFTGGAGGGANFPVMITTGLSKFQFRDALFAVLDQHKTTANLATMDPDVVVPVGKKLSDLNPVINGVHASFGRKISDFVEGMLPADTQIVMAGLGMTRNQLRDALRDAAEAGF